MQKDDDEDWTDADFVNDISERDQRFGTPHKLTQESKRQHLKKLNCQRMLMMR